LESPFSRSSGVVGDETPEPSRAGALTSDVLELDDSGVFVMDQLRYSVLTYLIPYVVQSAAYVGCVEPATVGEVLVHSADAAITLS
jgi:hypothetical protein